MRNKATTIRHRAHAGKTRLFPLISVYLLFVASATGIAYYVSTIIQQELIDNIEFQLNKQALIDRQLHAIHARHILVRDILMEEDPFIKDDYISLLSEYARAVLKARQDLVKLPLSEKEKRLINQQWLDSRSGYQALSDLVRKSTHQDHSSHDALYKELVENTQADFLRRMQELGAYSDELHQFTNNALQDAERNQFKSWILIFIFYLLTLLGGAGAIFWFYRSHREHLETLDWQASHDSLTELPNRHEFERQLQTALEDYQKTSTNCVVLYLDLDQFKLLNDFGGHAAGDELLKRLGNKLLHIVRTGDIVARLGGDEFGILLHGCDAEHAFPIAQNICDMVKHFPFEWNGKNTSCAVSIGLAQTSKEYSDIASLLKSADTARYTAKDMGGNQVHLYTKDEQISTARLQELEQVNQIKKALTDDNFILYSQRIIPLQSDLPEFSEILVRMLDENKQVILPGKFLPAAEHFNLIGNIDLWVVKKLCEFIIERTNQMHSFSVNLSGATLSSPTRMQEIVQLVKSSGVNPKLIIFEVTETLAIQDLSGAINFMHEIKTLGCKIALDDFGSGLSSFTYLKQMPIDFLKIDGSFIHKLQPKTLDFSFVESIRTIAKTMNIYTIAEWVEDEAVLEYLKILDIDYVQGNYTGKPSPLW